MSSQTSEAQTGKKKSLIINAFVMMCSCYLSQFQNSH